MIMAPDTCQSQQVLPDLRQHGFNLTNRHLITAYSHSRLLRRGQRLAIQLAVRSQREGRQHYKGTGQHIIGQMRYKLLTQFSRHEFNIRLREKISHQTGIARDVFAGDDNSVAYSRALGKACLDFAEFNTETAQLDLKVVTAEVFDIAVGQPAAKIPGFVQTGIRGSGERVGNKTLCCQCRTVKITAGHTGPADIKLAGYAEGHRLVMRVKKIGAQVR